MNVSLSFGQSRAMAHKMCCCGFIFRLLFLFVFISSVDSKNERIRNEVTVKKCIKKLKKGNKKKRKDLNT